IASFPFTKGDDATVRNAFAAGGSIVLPEQMALRIDKQVGYRLNVRTTQGIKPFTLVATYAQVGNNIGPAFSIKDAALFGAGRPNGFLLKTRDGSDPEQMRRTIIERLRPKYQIEVETSAAIKQAAHAQLQGFFGLAYALLFVAAIVGMLGLANTMVVS